MWPVGGLPDSATSTNLHLHLQRGSGAAPLRGAEQQQHTMSHPFTILYLPNLPSFRGQVERWDDLWCRSLVTHPTAHADLITAWLDRFCPREPFQAVVVCRGDQFVAALPLLPRRKGHLVPCLDVPGNEWSSAGQLLLDPGADPCAVCDCLIEGLHQLACPVYWFASIPLHSPWWQALVAAAERAHWSVERRVRYQVGRLELAASWPQQRSLLSKGLRKQLGRSLRGLESLGSLQLRFTLPRSESEAVRLLDRGLRLEHAGWKGGARTALLSHAQAAHFAHDQARQLALQQQLAMVSLELDGHQLAFEYGWLAKRVYHSYKVAYDPQFRRFGPGNVLVYLLLQRLHAAGDAHAIDFLGPLDDAVRRWCPASYSMGRLLLAPPRPLGKAIVLASRYLGAGHDPSQAAISSPMPIG